MNTSLHIQVMDATGHTYYINDIPLLLHSRWLMQWLVSNRLHIAAWITPNDPAVVDLVRRAEARLPSQPPPVPHGMIGYKGTPQEVTAQVDAIYDALRLDYRIKYIPASVPYNGADNENSEVTQYVKLPSEVLQQRNGMCVDLTILLAAAVERIGLHAQIVIIPGHAFLGVSVTEDDKQVQYWDAVDVNNNIAADSANVAANNLFAKNLKQHAIVDTIRIKEARAAHIGPMV
jgi:transglutaminase-like putative cysteine protease